MNKNNNINLLTLILVFLIILNLTKSSSMMNRLLPNHHSIEDNVEKMTCIFSEKEREKLHSSFLWDKDFVEYYKHLFEEKKSIDVNDKKILISLLTKKSTYKNDSKSIKELFIKPKFACDFIEKLISYSSLDYNKQYAGRVNENTLICDIKHLLLILRIRRLFYCKRLHKLLGDSSNIIFKEIINLLSKDIVRICDKEEVLEYCKNFKNEVSIGEINSDIVKKELNAFKNGQNLELNDRKITEKFESYSKNYFNDFSFFSVKESVFNFYQKDKYFNDDLLHKLLENLVKKKMGVDVMSSLDYSEINSGFIKSNPTDSNSSFDILDTNSLREIIIILLEEISTDIKKYESLKDGTIEKGNLSAELVIGRDLFYNLKFHYKVLSIYNIINNSKLNEEDKKEAYSCCSQNNKKCFNFTSDPDNPTPVVFGTNDFGYVKDSKCTPEYLSDLAKEQSKPLKVFLDKIEDWKNLEEYEKDLFIDHVDDLVNYYTDHDGDVQPTIEKKSLFYFLGKINRLQSNRKINNIFTSQLRPLTKSLTISELKFENIIPKETKNLINLIEESKGFKSIKEILKDSKIGNDLDRNFNFILLGNLNLIKFSIIKLIEIKSLFIYVNANQKLLNIFMKKILNLENSNLNFYVLLKKVGILPSNFKFFLEKLVQILSDVTYIKIKSEGKYKLRKIIMLSDKPVDAIKYTLNIFPTRKSEDLCLNYIPILVVLRGRRVITPTEYLRYKDLIDFECKNFESIDNQSYEKYESKKSKEDNKYNDLMKLINNYIDSN